MPVRAIGFITLFLIFLAAQISCQSTHKKKDLISCPPGAKLVHETDMGQKVQACRDKDGHNHGTHAFIYPNGHIRLKGNYDHGRSNGKFTQYYENGRKMNESEFCNGIPCGTSLFYKTDGSLEAIVQYYKRDNKRMQLTLRGDGTKLSEGELGNQLIRNGKWKFWYKTGQLKEEGEFVNHKKNGLWIQYDEQGNKMKRTHYENGVEIILEN